jgi:tetratricopeptide (TPR) repeat protein
MRKICLSVFLALMLTSVLMSTVQAQSPQETLKQYISDLQKNPNDYALREKIIKHVQTMRPVPAIPEEARRYFVEGNALLKAAKAQKGYGLAIDAYRQCLLIAPWWAEALYNYAVALDLANQFDEGMNALKLYIATNPGGEESRKAQDKIYEIGAKKKLAAQEREESSPQAVAAREEKKSDDWLKKLDGRRYTYPAKGGTNVIDVRGKVLVLGYIFAPGQDAKGYHEMSTGYYTNTRFEIRGREFMHLTTKRSDLPRGWYWAQEAAFKISDDGDSITLRHRWSDGDVTEWIYLWQR